MFLKISFSQFRYLCLSTLCLALFVILWGAWLRFSYAGDGCGTHWPLCNANLIPTQGSATKTWMEWFHRLTSSFFGLMVLAIVFFSFQFPKKHKIQLWSLLTLAFTLIEALIGAVLVLAGLTGYNQSIARLFVLNAHLINSLFLIGSIVMCWRHTFNPNAIPFKKMIKWQVSYIIIAITGSIASLSNTLFPSTSLTSGFLTDFDKNSPLLLQLRILHPLLAIIIGGGAIYYLIWKFYWKEKQISQAQLEIKNQNSNKKLFTEWILCILLGIGIATGFTTLLTLSPLVMKLLHLIIAYSIWLSILLIK